MEIIGDAPVVAAIGGLYRERECTKRMCSEIVEVVTYRAGLVWFLMLTRLCSEIPREEFRGFGIWTPVIHCQHKWAGFRRFLGRSSGVLGFGHLSFTVGISGLVLYSWIEAIVAGLYLVGLSKL